jgi:hypothetical protein
MLVEVIRHVLEPREEKHENLILETRMTKSSTLNGVNAIRIIGEYIVFRLHVLRFSIGMDMFVRELMSFFVILSGFSMMYRYYDLNLSTREEARAFVWRKWWTLFPFYLFGWACALQGIDYTADNPPKSCFWRVFCPVLQFFMLDCWAGCGVNHTGNNLSWLISCLWWIWLEFLMLKETIIAFFYTGVWLKMSVVGIVSTAVIIPLAEYDVSVISALPLMRAGEFVIGCGTACALRQRKSINDVTEKWYWCPFVLSLGGMLVIYSILGSTHGVDSLCLQRELYSHSCTPWGKTLHINSSSTPCYTTGDILFNKNAIPWEIVIYCVAQAELDGNTGVIMRFLGHDLFKFLQSFSLTLFLCHPALGNAVKWAAAWLLGWRPEEVQTDVLLITVYSMAFLIHFSIRRVISTLRKKYASIDLSSSMPLIPLSDPIPEFDNSVPEENLSASMISTEQCLESTNPGEY